MARRPMPGRAHVLGPFDPARRRQRQRADAPCGAGRRDSDRSHRASPGAAVDGARAIERRSPNKRTRPGRARCLNARGALFFDELAEASRLLRPQLEEALGELAALGLAASDSFSGLRALLVPSGQRKPPAGMKRRGRVLSFDIESGGRWAMINRTPPQDDSNASREAAVDMRRGRCSPAMASSSGAFRRKSRGGSRRGGIFLRVYRRLEARGEIRGGRFVAGFSGEQFALPDAVGLCARSVGGRRRASGCRCLARSAQSDRHPDARTKALGAHRESRGLPGRSASRGADRRQDPILDRARNR